MQLALRLLNFDYKLTWLLLLDPEEVTLELGPTEIMRRSQYLVNSTSGDASLRPDDTGPDYLSFAYSAGNQYNMGEDGGVHVVPAHYGRPKFVTVPAGSVVMMHYDMWRA